MEEDPSGGIKRSEPLRNAAAPVIFGHGPSEIAIGCEIRLSAGEIALRAVEVSLRDGLEALRDTPQSAGADSSPYRGARRKE